MLVSQRFTNIYVESFHISIHRQPVLTSTYECKYTVEWFTEAACADDDVVQIESCKINSDGVDIDLSPLKRDGNSNCFYKTKLLFVLDIFY